MHANFEDTVPGWMGTLVIDFSGNVLHSAGDLADATDKAHAFVDMSRQLGLFLKQDNTTKVDPFRRINIMCANCAFTVTNDATAIYVVKRQLNYNAESGKENTLISGIKTAKELQHNLPY